jgi:hypothetical protein
MHYVPGMTSRKKIQRVTGMNLEVSSYKVTTHLQSEKYNRVSIEGRKSHSKNNFSFDLAGILYSQLCFGGLESTVIVLRQGPQLQEACACGISSNHRRQISEKFMSFVRAYFVETRQKQYFQVPCAMGEL